MHVYNAWLPHPVAEETKKEKDSFTFVVKSVRESWKAEDSESVYDTLKWIPVIELSVLAKSEVHLDDVKELVELGLQIFSSSQNKLYTQVKWANILARLLKRHGAQISLVIPWRPLYDTLMHTHFQRNPRPEGWKLRQRHFRAIRFLVRHCRRFFPSGSTSEIWSLFRSLLDSPWHNASFEGSGFLNLFMPMNMENQDFYSPGWIQHCLKIWCSIPKCHFWDMQWTEVIARCIKKYICLDWEKFLPCLFTRFLNMFEVPLSSGNGRYPYFVDVPRDTRLLFSDNVVIPSKAIAKCIVYLLKPGSSAQECFEKMVNHLELYYHPSNGGSWTHLLACFLRYLVTFFQKRLQYEHSRACDDKSVELCMGEEERVAFVKVVLRLIQRGQYSKNDSLSGAVAESASILAYVEPSVVLPFIASSFHVASDTMIATHQMKIAVTSVALACRAFLQASVSASSLVTDFSCSTNIFLDVIKSSLYSALHGIDANDPPKTLVTIELVCSVFSNVTSLKDNVEAHLLVSVINFSEWLDEFFCRLFSLLQHLEPHSNLIDGMQVTLSRTFLVEDGSYYFCMLEILLGKLSNIFYNQILQKISKFVNTNFLPGAVVEVGLLCCACLHSNPDEALVHLIRPILESVISSLKEAPVSGIGENTTKVGIAPGLESEVAYQLMLLSVAISHAGPVVLHCKKQLMEAIALGFEVPSWKVNGCSSHLLRTLLCCLILYYPVDQYKSVSCHPNAAMLEEWICSKDDLSQMICLLPMWHIPTDDEILFANEILEVHLYSSLDDLLRMCQSKIHIEPGYSMERLKGILLQIDSSLQGILSCLPDFSLVMKDGKSGDQNFCSFIIAGSSGATVGSSELREKAAEIIHMCCKFLLEEGSDDSILLKLIVQIIDKLENSGSLEYVDWSNHRHAWRLESLAVVEPAANFIVSSHAGGKKRPRWALTERVFMHNKWRSSQASYHMFRINSYLSPSKLVTCLMDDLLNLCLHNYETVRFHAGKSLIRLLKRWPSLISKCILTLTENLMDPNVPEHAVLGSCTILSAQIVLRHLVVDSNACSAFILAILSSTHHESLRVQKAISELFVKYNINFPGIPRTFFKSSRNHSERVEFEVLVSQIASKFSNTVGLHWRYDLMADRVLLLLALASLSHSNVPSTILFGAIGHFLNCLKSQLPQTRVLAVSALNALLHESPHGICSLEHERITGNMNFEVVTSLESLKGIVLKKNYFEDVFSNLSHVHIITENVNISSDGNHVVSSFHKLADKSIMKFYFDFSTSWPRTPHWISLLMDHTFYPNFARLFERLIQEYDMHVVLALKSTLEVFLNATERSKQCVAAEALAGILHSDINGLLEAWDDWIMCLLEKVILAPSTDTLPEWAACIRYAVTGMGKYGEKIPLLRQKILECLVKPLPLSVSTNMVVKRYAFLSAALMEVSSSCMPTAVVQLHEKLLVELANCMMHSSAQVREAVGITLSIVCSNLRLHSRENAESNDDIQSKSGCCFFVDQASDILRNIQSLSTFDSLQSSDNLAPLNGVSDRNHEDIWWMETMFYFIISSLRSGRSSYLLDVIVKLLYPVISLQETSFKDLALLAKSAFELLKWGIFSEPYLEKAVFVLLSSCSDYNWRTRLSTITYFQALIYRHTFVLSYMEKQHIWAKIEELLIDRQIEVREHAAQLLANLMRVEDEAVSIGCRERAFIQVNQLLEKRGERKNKNVDLSLSSIHGPILALSASVLAVPYDVPRWLPDHVTLLALFVNEPSPVRSTVTKTVAEFRRTHADTWCLQKDYFSEEQLEILAGMSTSSSYFV